MWTNFCLRSQEKLKTPPEDQQNRQIQRDRTRNNEQEHQQHQQNENGEPSVVSQEDRAQTINKNVRRRKKRTKQMNIDIVRCYYKTILQTPNLLYRKEFYRN